MKLKITDKKLVVTKEELNTLAKLFPKMTVLEFIELKKKMK